MKRLVLVVLALALTSCVPPTPNNDEIKRYDPEETIMGRIQEAGVLRYTVPTGSTEQILSFYESIAQDIADALDVDVDLSTDSTIPDLDSGTIDMAFTLAPITYQRVLQRPHTDPYWIGHQRLIAAEGSNIAGPADLQNKDVCQSIDPATGVDIRELAPDAHVIDAFSPQTCLEALADGRVEAISMTDLTVATLNASGEPTFVGDDLSTVGYGIVVAEGAAGWESFISVVLNEAESEGRWEQWRSMLEIDSEEPDLSVEDAAALYPDA